MKTITFRPSKKNSTLIVQLTELANKQNRNLNNYIETVLIEHVESNPVITPDNVAKQ